MQQYFSSRLPPTHKPLPQNNIFLPELTLLCGCCASLVNHRQSVTLSSMTCYDLGRLTAAELLKPHLLCYINHILHDFISFTRCSSNIKLYEWHTYIVPASCKRDIHLIHSPFLARNEAFMNSQMVKSPAMNQCSSPLKKCGLIQLPFSLNQVIDVISNCKSSDDEFVMQKNLHNHFIWIYSQVSAITTHLGVCDWIRHKRASCLHLGYRRDCKKEERKGQKYKVACVLGILRITSFFSFFFFFLQFTGKPFYKENR